MFSTIDGTFKVSKKGPLTCFEEFIPLCSGHCLVCSLEKDLPRYFREPIGQLCISNMNMTTLTLKSLFLLDDKTLASYLKVLVLNHNKIERVQKDVFKFLHNLQALNLNSNLISDLQPGTLQGLSDLKVLDLSNNALETIKRHMFSDVPDLYYLYLDMNNISYIEHETFENHKKLKILSMKGNKIRDVHWNIF